jgi:hypothetical protein
MNIGQATKEFETWIGGHVPVVRKQLYDKHRLMAKDPVQFLRGTFYRWTQLFPAECPELNRAVAVLAVGDLHIASFGTWRDEFGRLIWGVDDFDEAYPLPYTSDLVRLAVSAVLDEEDGKIKVDLRNVCDVIVDGYTSCLAEGGRPFVLEECHRWLRKIALDRLDVPADFWEKLNAFPTTRLGLIPPAARRALASLLPAPRLEHRIIRRVAGIGSLGRPRYVAVAQWLGGQIALEAKAATPSACAWANPRAGTRNYYQEILNQAVRCPDPFVRLCGKWLVRQLAPDSSPIEIETMHGQDNQDRLLHAMAWEAANVHLGTARASKRILSDLKSRPVKWLRSATRKMAKAVMKDYQAWRKTHE